MFANVLVGIDGSVAGQRAWRAGVELAKRFESTLTLAVVLPGDAGGDVGRAPIDVLLPVGDGSMTLQARVEANLKEAEAAGVRVGATVYLRGKAADALLAHLRARPYDLVVVGSRGLSPGRRILLGSVSAALVSSAPCPVLVVRGHRPAGAPH